jgi:PKD repeat protein
MLRRTASFSFSLSLALVGACGDDDLQQIPNELPTADAGDAPAAFIGEVLTFDGSASSDPDGFIKHWAWDLGDGQVVEGESVLHIYNQPGLYTVELTVTDDRGATATDTLAISVAASSPPVAVIDAEITAEVGGNLRLDGTGSYDVDGSIATWDWDLGNGETRAGSIADVSYAAPGTYSVKLTVTDDEGLTGEVFHQVTITEPVLPATLDGTWQWSLVDPNQYNLGGTCGTFQDSMLQVSVTEPAISIVEQAGAISVDYSGTIDMNTMSFETVHSGLLSEQFIRGTFTSMTTFEGEYAIDVAFGDPCATRQVIGVKVQ